MMTITRSRDLERQLRRIAAVEHLLLCLDYDGTLAPIAPRPEQARLLPGASELLLRLARLPQTRVAIISGRSLDNLLAHCGLTPPVILVGSHGAELPGQMIPDATSVLDAVAELLAPICTAAPGAWLERKPLGIAVHVRQAAPADAAELLRKARDVFARYPGVYLREGKAVLELSVSQASKANAVRWLLDGWEAGSTTLYFGDDVTDEAAFAVLGPDDLGIKIGEGSSVASHRVESEHDVMAALAFLWMQRAERRIP